MRFQLDNVSFSYKSKALPPRPVFSDLNLTIHPGECSAVIGEEGSGKSTLLQLLDGLQRPDAGSVSVDGKNIWEKSSALPSLRRRIGFAFQFPEQQFFCETVQEELLYAPRNFGVEVGDDAVPLALSAVGLSPHILTASPFTLSSGEARRVALASLLVARPDTFLLDEPTASLDGFGIRTVQSVVAALKAEGKTIVIVTHQASLFLTIADRIVLLEDRKVADVFDPSAMETRGTVSKRFS